MCLVFFFHLDFNKYQTTIECHGLTGNTVSARQHDLRIYATYGTQMVSGKPQLPVSYLCRRQLLCCRDQIVV